MRQPFACFARQADQPLRQVVHRHPARHFKRLEFGQRLRRGIAAGIRPADVARYLRVERTTTAAIASATSLVCR